MLGEDRLATIFTKDLEGSDQRCLGGHSATAGQEENSGAFIRVLAGSQSLHMLQCDVEWAGQRV